MTTQFDRWEKDPFFSAAEEVQESADRMESTYRTWIHAKKDSSGFWNPDEVRRDLRTTLGTAKWQLEQFERAVRSSYYNNDSSADDAKRRHREFIKAMETQISKVESSLQESEVSVSKPPLPWMRLDKGETDELALFLSRPYAEGDKISEKIYSRNQQAMKSLEADSLRNPSSHSVEQGGEDTKEEEFQGHRRTASASPDISAWKITVDDDVFPHSSSNAPPPRILSSSGLLNTMESTSKLIWPKNGYRKLRTMDYNQEADAKSDNQHTSNGVDSCYDKTKSCLGSCDECYDKQSYGWYGAIQRQLQRSQYHMQYRTPFQLVIWIAVLCLIVLIVNRGF